MLIFDEKPVIFQKALKKLLSFRNKPSMAKTDGFKRLFVIPNLFRNLILGTNRMLN